jgi:hypothetical protein
MKPRELGNCRRCGSKIVEMAQYGVILEVCESRKCRKAILDEAAAREYGRRVNGI